MFHLPLFFRLNRIYPSCFACVIREVIIMKSEEEWEWEDDEEDEDEDW